MRKHSRFRRLLKWTGMLLCLLLVAAYCVSLKWCVWYQGSNCTHAMLQTATFVYHDTRGQATDLEDLESLGTMGWGMAPSRSIQPLWGKLSIQSSRPGEGRGSRLLGFNVMGAHERVTTRTIYVPLWILLITVGIPTFFLFRRNVQHTPPGHCRNCGYNLTGNVSGACSECGSTDGPAVPTRFSFRRWLRRGRFALALVIFLGTGSFCLYAHLPGSPRIIAINGFDDVFALDPLRVKKATFPYLSRLVPTNCIRTWDGTWLYANGSCHQCLRPLAKKGSFVLAKLPDGLAYAEWDASAPKHSHLTQPVYVSLTKLFATGTLLALCIAMTPYFLRRLRKPGK